MGYHLLLLALSVLTKAEGEVAHSLHACLDAHGFVVVESVVLSCFSLVSFHHVREKIVGNDEMGDVRDT